MIAETDETMRKGQIDVKRGKVEGGWEETGRRLGAEDSFVDRLTAECRRSCLDQIIDRDVHANLGQPRDNASLTVLASRPPCPLRPLQNLQAVKAARLRKPDLNIDTLKVVIIQGAEQIAS